MVDDQSTFCLEINLADWVTLLLIVLSQWEKTGQFVGKKMFFDLQCVDMMLTVYM